MNWSYIYLTVCVFSSFFVSFCEDGFWFSGGRATRLRAPACCGALLFWPSSPSLFFPGDDFFSYAVCVHWRDWFDVHVFVCFLSIFCIS